MRTPAPPLPTFIPDEYYSIEQWLAIEEPSGMKYEYHRGVSSSPCKRWPAGAGSTRC